MLTSPQRLSAIRVVGTRVVIPPKTPNEAPAIVPLNSGPGGKALAISKITADGVVLEFLPEDRGKRSYLLDATVRGTYNPLNQHVDLQGTIVT
jgi:hypothetical protein